MFTKEVYIRRRKALLEKMKSETGIAVFLGNADAPAQYSNNCYKFRQDSTWLYYFGIDEPRYAAVIDLESGEETIFADDADIDDIIWTGPLPSVREQAEAVGVNNTDKYSKLDWVVSQALITGRPIHTVNPSRYFNRMRLEGLGIDYPSVPLTKAIISMRLVKEPCEIELMDAACTLGQKMHRVARAGIRPGRIEQEIVGEMESVAGSYGWGVSFPTILTQHGEVFHCHSHEMPVSPGKLMVVDAGLESNDHYASDFTRTYPTSGRFTPKQKDIYSIVYDCNELAFSMTAPAVAYRDVHLAVSRRILDSLKSLGLLSGDTDGMLEAGVAGLFMPHGLGHNLGLDCHDMEDLGEDLVGYDDDQTRSGQLGLGNLRMARKLVCGNVVTDEPGIYFIPALIEKWKSEGTDKGYVNYGKLEAYYDFGGIRLEDDILVTDSGARRLGENRLEIAPEDVENAMSI